MKSTKKYIALPNSLLVSLTLEHQQRWETAEKKIYLGNEDNFGFIA